MRRAAVPMVLVFAPCVLLAAEDTPPVTWPSVSEEACPVEVVELEAADGAKVVAALREPPGDGPFPAVIFLHGGLSTHSLDQLRNEQLTNPLHTRCLAAGYLTIAPTFRSRQEDPLTNDALEDCLAVVDHVLGRADVDPRSVVVFGGSGGGSLALELASERPLAAVAAGEPASVLLTGLYSVENLGPRDGWQAQGNSIMKDPLKWYSAECQERTRAKLAKIECPILIVHGDKHPINIVNERILVPELRSAGKRLKVILYPDQAHGFYYGRQTPEVGLRCSDDCLAFFGEHVSTQPTPLDGDLVTRVAVKTEPRAGAGALSRGAKRSE